MLDIFQKKLSDLGKLSLTKQNLRKIRDRISDLLESRRMEKARLFLKSMLRPELFARNVYLDGDQDSYIDYLGNLCVEQGLATVDFIKDVHQREKVSSTAFTDALAIPHSIGGYSDSSFIAALHNDAAIPWGRHKVATLCRRIPLRSLSTSLRRHLLTSPYGTTQTSFPTRYPLENVRLILPRIET